MSHLKRRERVRRTRDKARSILTKANIRPVNT